MGWILDIHCDCLIWKTRPMKLIIAIIQPSHLEDVKAALSEVEVSRLTVMDCQGFGRQKGQTETYRGHKLAVNLLRKTQLQIAVNDEFVEATIAAVLRGGRSGEAGNWGRQGFRAAHGRLHSHSHR